MSEEQTIEEGIYANAYKNTFSDWKKQHGIELHVGDPTCPWLPNCCIQQWWWTTWVREENSNMILRYWWFVWSAAPGLMQKLPWCGGNETNTTAFIRMFCPSEKTFVGFLVTKRLKIWAWYWKNRILLYWWFVWSATPGLMQKLPWYGGNEMDTIAFIWIFCPSRKTSVGFLET